MAKPTITNMAVFCDFENVALGVRDARYARFDIGKVLERLLLKGSIVVKKAYCDWDRYKEFKGPMHEASFELIEIPHVRMSGKNSADIRMVVDALDLCYTKSHVDTFVVISGDSDFSPLVSKLRENNKIVIGVGVKSSTSDLLIANCDEFIYYDDLVRKEEQRSGRRKTASASPSPARRPAASTRPAAAPAVSNAGPSNGGRGVDGYRRDGRDERGGCVAARGDPSRACTGPVGRREEAGGVRSRAGHDRGPGRRARSGREDLGLDDQAGAEAPAPWVQRELPWLPQLQPAARGSARAQAHRAVQGRKVRRLHRACRLRLTCMRWFMDGTGGIHG
jgi:uncharacterized LabA/DUF88 family protein